MRLTQVMRGLAGFGAAAAIAFSGAYEPASAAAAAAIPRLKPAAPGPQYATPADLALLEGVDDALSRRDWARARNLAAAIGDPVARDLAQWRYFYAEDPLVSIADVDAFLDTHPDWPALTRIQLHAEKRMHKNLSPQTVLSFFETRDPISGEGALALARAQFAAGDREAAAIRIREAWVNLDFTLGDEQALLNEYGRHLTPEDHAARVDRLLWSRQVTAAKRHFPRLTSSERRKAEARAALLLAASTGPALYNSLPDEERADPGVMLAAVRYYRRADAEPIAVMIAKQAPQSPEALRNPARWWDETQLLMRWALTERQYADAYAMAAGHGLEAGGADFAEAEFNAGWIALRFLGEPERAETHFSALTASVGTPISLSRGFYWLGRAAEARGAKDIAEARYAQAAAHIYTYYGQLAAERLGGALAAQGFAAPTTPTEDDRARFRARPTAKALGILSDLRADHPFLVFAYHLDDQLETAGEYVELMRLADRMRATHVTVRAGKVGVGRDAFAPEVAFPLIPLTDEATRFAPPEIILGLSRQESEFNPRAFSSAGARGLMQLLPSTAQLTARKERLRYDRSALLDDPFYNMTIGAAHLSHLFERYDGSLIMTFAAYNAGPHRVTQWVERYGDPRGPGVDPVDWVEQIPFAETRNYVQRVLENTQIYRARLNEAPIAGRLAADLERGGASGRAGRLAGLSIDAELPPLSPRIVRIAADGPHLPPLSPAVAEAADGANDGVLENPPAAPQQAPAGEPRARQQRRQQKPAAGKASPISYEPARAGPLSPPAPRAREAETAEAQSRAEALAEILASPAPEPEPEDQGECVGYREFLVEADPEEVSADDLNASMRAELASGGPAC